MKVKCLISGATGFVGQAVTTSMVSKGFEVTALVRNKTASLPHGVKTYIADLNDLDSSLEKELEGVDIVVHAAARAHMLIDESIDPLEEYRKVNRDSTLALAQMAVNSNVKRFVFISSIGVLGNQNKKPFTELDIVSPHDAYTLSKYEAELGLQQIAEESDMEVVIVRPPLVYGENAPGNFASLIKWVKKGIPLPFGLVKNKRSLVALDNLVDFIILCADTKLSPNAANQVFLISDGKDVSTSELLRKVSWAYGVKLRLFPVPVSAMKFVAKLFGKQNVANRLFSNLQVDSSKARDLLGWHPIVTMDDQLAKMAKNEKRGSK